MSVLVRVSRIFVAILVGIILFAAAPVYAEPGVTNNSITIGMSAAFSGLNGSVGQDMRDAIRSYFAQVNATGGVHGRKLEIDAIDDNMEVSKTRNNTTLFVNDRQSFALMAYCGDENTAAALELASAARVPIVGAVSGAQSLRLPVSRYLFHTRASSADEIEAIVKQVASLGLTRVAVFYQNDRSGKADLNEVVSALKKFNLTPAAIGAVEAPVRFVAEVKVTEAFNAISKVKPQVVLMLTSYEPAAALVQLMKKADLQPQYLALSTVGTDPLVQQLGPLARGIGISQVLPHPWDNTVPLIKEYQNTMRFTDKESVFSFASLEGYIMARVMVAGLRRAGKELSREKLIAALEAMDLNLGAYRVRYSPEEHHGSNLVYLTVIGANGRVMH